MFFFVFFLRLGFGELCLPFVCSLWKLRAWSRVIAFFTTSSRQEPVYQFHHISGEIWKKCIAKHGRARRKSKCERWLTTAGCGEDFSRSTIGVHRNERRTAGSSEPGKLIRMV